MFKPRGSLLLEAIIAVGLAASFITAVMHLALLSNEAMSKVEERGEANYLAQQAIESVATMKFSDLSNINNGKTVFDVNTSKWTIQPGQEVLANGMIRQITITDVQRDSNCNVVSSGGTIDVDSKRVSGSIQWTDITGVNKTITHGRHITNWESPTGPCFGQTMAESTGVDTTTAAFSGAKNLRGIYITNNSAATMTITSVTMTWDTPTSVDQFFITDGSGDAKVWSDSGPGLPSGAQSSVATLDIEDRSILPGVQAELNKIRFSANMPGSTITIQLTFSDSSVLTIGPMTPP